MYSQEVHYEMARPATRWNIFLWFITNGRKGELFIKKTEPFIMWTNPPINCRCETKPLVKTMKSDYAKFNDKISMPGERLLPGEDRHYNWIMWLVFFLCGVVRGYVWLAEKLAT